MGAALIPGIIGLVIGVVLAIFLLQASTAFRKVALTDEADQHYLLLGFSKSGWGAWSLLLRHPEVFGRAAAWDAPLTKDRPDQFGMGPIFGTQANFMKYHVRSLLRKQAEKLRGSKRLALLGYGVFRNHHRSIHGQLGELEIPHEYRDGPKRRHHWSGGWVSEAVEFLAAEKKHPPKAK